MKTKTILFYLVGVSCLWTSCSNSVIDVPGTDDSGEEKDSANEYIVSETGDTLFSLYPEIHISSTQGNSLLSRSLSLPLGKGVTLYVNPATDDQVGATTRASSALPKGSTVRMLAYKSENNELVGNLIYNASDNDGNLVPANRQKFYLPHGSYYFYFISPASAANLQVDATNRTLTAPQGINLSWNNTPLTTNVDINHSGKLSAQLQLQCARISNIAFVAADASVTSLVVNSISLEGIGTTTTCQAPFKPLPTLNADLQTGSATRGHDAFRQDIDVPTTFTLKPDSAIYLLPQNGKIHFKCSLNVNNGGDKEYSGTFNNISLLAAGRHYTLGLMISKP